MHVDGYRSFTFDTNGDGVDFFCSSDILIENCSLRNLDDNIALHSHRWDWYGDSTNITIRNCVDIQKTRWYMTMDYVPLFSNEHIKGLKFVK